ncbi:hypothetical protein HO133_007634 [Letharia lupina]|uniref:Uncharacterized protein n=1 Tax=Letharia lupina TaxID=560253 RepID=A0A8H6CRC2_9LECA|nr:uncharacterized protein HO133_007634 [Letharia lupina]KAF6227906.1 hypothetical protein HO133_007634 [Letharia lupina]
MGYHVDSAFLPVLFSFGDEPHLAESGAINVATESLGAYALDAKNQYTVTETNKGMEIVTRKTNFLTEKTAEFAEKSTMDNTVIKWITIVSLFYLPGSFVTVMEWSFFWSSRLNEDGIG